MQVVGSAAQISEAIDSFPIGYHRGFFRVRAIGRQYLADPQPTPAAASSLARGLHRVLTEWGAGKRKAPRLRSIPEIEAALLEPAVHTALSTLAQTQLQSLSVDLLHRRTHHQPARSDTAPAIDSRMLATLRLLADRLLVGNTNVTYPMKTALLVTGLMPALDSQVRTGLGRGGFEGLTGQFLLPSLADSTAGKKLTSLAFVLGKCWSAFRPQLAAGISSSRFPQLMDEPGRVFDVLLFMQAYANRPIILRYSGGDRTRWFDLL